MPKNFYSLGYNLADTSDLRMTSIKFNSHDYPSDDFDSETFNLTSWWTPSMQTEIQARFSIRRSEISTDCSLRKEDELFLTLYSYCPGTKLQHIGKPLLIDSDEVEIQLTIPADELAEDFSLYAVITTRFNEKKERKVGAPQKSNSRLLTKNWKIYLSGSQTQANVVFLDFSKDKSRAKALWQIVINENLEKIFDFYIPEKFKLNDIYIWNPGILSSNIIIKKKIFDLIGGYDPKISGSADKDLLIKIINNNYKYFVIKERLVLYVNHNEQWSKNYKMIYHQSKLFFKKYKNQMNIITKSRFYKKLLMLFLKSILR
jgi:hypothetical protein